MYICDVRKIRKLQKNLYVLRRMVGWTAEDLASQLGVSRQTVSAIEKNEGVEMTRLQYIAIRAIFDYEIKENQNDALANAIELMVDREDISDAQQKEIDNEVDKIMKSTNRKAGNAAILAGMTALCSTAGPIGIIVGGLAAKKMKEKNGSNAKKK